MADHGQLTLPFDEPFSVSDQPDLWTPRDIWVRFSQGMTGRFVEDRRIEFKSTKKINVDDLRTSGTGGPELPAYRASQGALWRSRK